MGVLPSALEVEGVVGVLPDVLAAEHSVLSQSLLQARVELVEGAGSRDPIARLHNSGGDNTAFEQPLLDRPGLRGMASPAYVRTKQPSPCRRA